MILIVDDHQNMCWILSKVLSEAGLPAKTANTSAEALAIFDKGGISAAIIDFRLSDGNGFDLFSALKKRDKKIRGMLITSYGSTKLREEALNLGFFAYFDKPFDNQALLSTLKEAIGQGSRGEKDPA